MRYFTIIIMMLIASPGFAQNNPIDFEPDGYGADWTWTVFENETNPPLEIIDNPDQSGINTSATVAKFTALQDGNPWAGVESAHGVDLGTFEWSDDNRIVKIMVWKSVISDVGIKFATEAGWAQEELKVSNTVTNEWEELTFDFSDFVNPPDDGEDDLGTLGQIIIFPDFDERDQDNVIYFDNITFNPVEEDADEFVYSIAMQLPAGDYEYKYFLVVDDPTWENDEWAGDPNRSVTVESEMTVEDLWGEQPENDNGKGDKEDAEYIVTFELTIEEGTLVGDIVFDPDEHHIFIAGSFPYGWEWNEPGSNPLLELTIGDDDPIVSTPDISAPEVAVNIFPNPASDRITVESDAQISEIRMFDVLGQVVYAHVANDKRHEISVGSIKAGVYFVQLTTEHGIITQKVQVTR